MDKQTVRAEIQEFLNGFQDLIAALRPLRPGESDEELAAVLWRDGHRARLERSFAELNKAYRDAIYDIQREKAEAEYRRREKS